MFVLVVIGNHLCIKTFASLSDRELSSRMRCPQREGWGRLGGESQLSELQASHHHPLLCCSIMSPLSINVIIIIIAVMLFFLFSAAVLSCLKMTEVVCWLTWV